jgi:uncharacterized protein (DUF427 family)
MKTGKDPFWGNTGQHRPEFAENPAAGQESVWDYPRPPVGRRDNRLVEVRDAGDTIATSHRSYKLMETASPPTFYIPQDDVNWDLLVAVQGSSVCEWKGAAVYWALARNPQQPVGWSYPRPRARFDMIKDYVAFYPAQLACSIDGELVRPQPGRFYGGWITSELVGPFKGEPGTGHW